jgi:hypothetical protein
MIPDILSIILACCSLTCCLLTLVAIVGGIVFVLRRNSGVHDETYVSPPVGSSKPTPAPTVAPQAPPLPEADTDDEGPTLVAPPSVVLGVEDVPEPPAARKPRAGQTIIAFDDEDDDF